MKIGVISDTHNFLDPRVLELFAGVDHILHGGDIGQPSLVAELEVIAPVTAVAGNTDDFPGYRPIAVVNLAEKKFLLHHIVTPGDAHQAIHLHITKEAPDVVIFGHTHKPFAELIGRTLFFNPGYAGRSRFGMERTVAILKIENGRVGHQFILL